MFHNYATIYQLRHKKFIPHINELHFSFTILSFPPFNVLLNKQKLSSVTFMQLTRFSAAGFCLCNLRLSVYNLHRISKTYDLEDFFKLTT